MIPQSYIAEWSEKAPWGLNQQVEQDLIICRALVAIYSDDFLAEHLASRGGTALGKLYLQPQPRYSEDIDLVQVSAEPIKETIDHLRDVLARRCHRISRELLILLLSTSVQTRIAVGEVAACYLWFMVHGEGAHTVHGSWFMIHDYFQPIWHTRRRNIKRE